MARNEYNGRSKGIHKALDLHSQSLYWFDNFYFNGGYIFCYRQESNATSVSN